MTGVRFWRHGVDLRGSFCLWQRRHFFKDQLNSRGHRDPISRLRQSRYVETTLRSLSTKRTLRSAIVQSEFKMDVLRGDTFLFLSKRRDRVKAMWWDIDGLAIYMNSAWATPFIGGSHEFLKQPGVRNLDARSLFFYLCTYTTPAMSVKMVGKGSQYGMAFTDANSAPLDGGKTYKLHLPPNIPAKNFWSIVVYDNQTRSMLQTDAQFPSIGSQKQGVVINPDTSVDVWFGPTAPAGHEANWVQTVPGKGWFPAWRLYGPLEPWFDKTWRLGEIELVK